MKKFIYTILATFLFVNVQAQTINGKILDNETKEPIVGALVQSVSGLQSATSNNEGKFNITLKNTTDSLKISFIGYQTLVVASKPNLVISLNNNAQQLQSVVITTNREVGLRTQSPIAISKLSPKLINESKASMVFELINKTPGVIMPSYNNEQHESTWLCYVVVLHTLLPCCQRAPGTLVLPYLPVL